MKLKESRIHITAQELKDAFPDLYQVYQETYGSKRPNITAQAIERYNFAPQVSDSMTDYFVNRIWAIMRNGEVYTFDSNSGDKKVPHFTFNLIPGDAILELDYGQYKGADLYVHPSFLVQQIAGDPTEGLSVPEIYVLLCFKAYIPKIRREYFINPPSWSSDISISNSRFKYNAKEFWQEVKDLVPSDARTKNDAYDYILGLLEDKGYLKISANGASQLTQNGKNKAESLVYYEF